MVFIITGAEESGGNTVGKLLAEELGWEFLEADNLHTLNHLAARKWSTSLADADPTLRLEALSAAINSWIYEWRDVVLSCPMLKEAERTQLSKMSSLVKIVCLEQPASSRARLQKRSAGVANSQLSAGSEGSNEEVVIIDSSRQVEEVIAEITTLLIIRSLPSALPFSSSSRGNRNNPSRQIASTLRRSG